MPDNENCISCFFTFFVNKVPKQKEFSMKVHIFYSDAYYIHFTYIQFKKAEFFCNDGQFDLFEPSDIFEKLFSRASKQYRER